ncbi:MAG: hypothetical protein IAF02_03150 [Anaerolineae bacterium]|nr:hypothetical protein [Anaerolineae bacterium]
MEQVFVFILRNDVWIYILSVLGIIWYTSQFLQSRKILKRAMFGLEREKGARMQTTAVFFLLFFITTTVFVLYVNNTIAPTIPDSAWKPPTPTPNIFATPLSSPTPLGTAEIRPPEPTPALVPTITLAANALNPPTSSENEDTQLTDLTPIPETATPSGPTPTPFVDCTITLNISEPTNGSVVSEVINFRGTANTPDFAYFRLEANGPETEGVWASLLGRDIDQPVQDNFMGNVNLSQWGDGPYLIRLTTVDSGGFVTGQCVIQVTLDNP